MSYKKPFYLCPDQCILVHLQSHHFKGCPQQPWEEGKVRIVLPLWEMQERGPGREGVDGSSISVALHQAPLFSLWWGFEKLFQRGKSVKIQATRPMFARGQEEYKCTNGQGSRGLTAGKMSRAGRTAHPCARSLTGLTSAPLPGSEACGASSARKQGFGLPVSSRASVTREGASLSWKELNWSRRHLCLVTRPSTTSVQLLRQLHLFKDFATSFAL